MDDNRIPLPVIHHETITSRREFLARAGGGFGTLALCSLLAEDRLLWQLKVRVRSR